MSFIVIQNPPDITVELDSEGGVIVTPSSGTIQVIEPANETSVLQVLEGELFWGKDDETHIKPLNGKKVPAAYLEVEEFDPSILDDLFGAKVDKVEGKGLSTNDYTNDDATAVSKIVIDGDGSKALRDDGTYQDQTPPPRIISFYLDDVQDVEEDAVSYRLPFDMILTRVTASVGVAPVGADLILDIHRSRWNTETSAWDEVSIYTTQANRPKIVAGSRTVTAELPDISVLLEGDILEVQVDQVGSSTPGSNLNLILVAGDMLPESTFTAELLESLKGLPGVPGDPGEDGEDGVGLPTGGTVGQILAKMNSNDFEYQWVNPTIEGNSAYTEYVDPFTTDPIGTRVAGRVNGTWSHEATEKALKVIADQTGSGAFASHIGAPICGSFGRVDVQFNMKVTVDSAARKHVGMFLETEGVAGTGYRIAGLDGNLKISRFTNGGSESVLATIAFGGFSVGTVYTLRVVCDFALSKLFAFINGAYIGQVAITASDMYCRPGYFAYGSTVLFDNLDYKYTQVNILGTAMYTRQLTSVDAPPSSPHAKNDEFISSPLDSKWAWANQGTASYSLTEKPGFIGITTPADQWYRVLCQPVPVGPWTATAKLHAGGSFTADFGAGIICLPASDGMIETIGLGNGSSGDIGVGSESWNGWTTWNTSRFSRNYCGTVVYLKMVYNGSTITTYFSSDGITWRQCTTFTPSFTPGRIGIGARGSANPSYFDWFRIT